MRSLTCAALAALLLFPPPPARTVIAVGTALDGRGGVLRNTRLVIADGKISSPPTAIRSTTSPPSAGSAS